MLVFKVFHEQASAALALGMTNMQTMRLVVLPQAFKAMVPLLLTQGIVLFQDSSLVCAQFDRLFRTATNIGERDGTQVEMAVCGSGVLYCQFGASMLVNYLKKGLFHDNPENVSKWYGQFQVLTDRTTEVKKGEVGLCAGHLVLVNPH